MKTQQCEAEAEVLPEYTFSGKKGVRGKYHHAYQQGHVVRIHQEDGSITTQYFTLEDGAVLLAPDVLRHALFGEPADDETRRCGTGACLI